MKDSLYSSARISTRLLTDRDIKEKKRKIYTTLLDRLSVEFIDYVVKNKLVTFSEKTEATFIDDEIVFRAKLDIEVDKDKFIYMPENNSFYNWAKEKHPEYIFEFLMIEEE
jgi:hypothetical protein